MQFLESDGAPQHLIQHVRQTGELVSRPRKPVQVSLESLTGDGWMQSGLRTLQERGFPAPNAA